MARGSVLWVVAAAVLLALLGAAAALLAHRAGGAAVHQGAAAAGAGGCGGGGGGLCEPVTLVMVGMHSCPHCRAMEEWLPGLGYPVVFCDIQRSLVCSDVFTELYNRGVARGVPVIAACRGGELLFIEVGELRDRAWWLQALRNASRGPGAGVPVYAAGRLAATLTGQEAAELSSLLCVKAAQAAEPLGGG